MNPWPIIGGVANVVCHEDEYIKVNQGKPGDKLVLTKPLGTQVAVNLNEWATAKNERWQNKASKHISQDSAKDAYYLATESMGHLNKNAAELMQTYKCHGATDVTGFGIRGHADNLAQVQKEEVNFKIEALPIIDGMEKINNEVMDFKLLQGYSAETSGGLLIMVPPDKVFDYQSDLENTYGQKSWVIGELVPGKERRCIFGGSNGKPDIINVKHFLADDF